VSDAAIEVEGLSKSFGRAAAVRGVNLHVGRGGVYAFLGPNGAGKSTTIRLCLGLLKPTAGRIAILGLDLAAHRLTILARTGSLIEHPSSYPHLTARENLEVARRILGAPRSDIDRVLEIVGLERRARSLVRTFSLGMKQRLGLAQAMLGRRDLLILDEPTNGLDPQGMSDIRSLVRRLPSDHGVTVFLSTHLLSEVEQVATHVGILSQGELVFEGSAAELAARREPRLRIRVDRPDAASSLLGTRGWTVRRSDDALIATDTAAAAAINRTLVAAGHEVHHLAIESASLEDVFLGMTQAEVR
jgi:ABC-2 type transport system ATP-binding protein